MQKNDRSSKTSGEQSHIPFKSPFPHKKFFFSFVNPSFLVLNALFEIGFIFFFWRSIFSPIAYIYLYTASAAAVAYIFKSTVRTLDNKNIVEKRQNLKEIIKAEFRADLFQILAEFISQQAYTYRYGI